ncbi:testis-expressed protein 264-like [Dysidea avara]|uniref:testis-expressed protein 264-like n=1 Tax=Dysidea avara TaxID=196820 RepID=UPI0033168904
MWQTDLVFYLVMFVILVISAVLVVLTHAGYFHTVRVRMATPHVQPRHFAYVVKTGPYKSCAEAFSSLAMLAPKKILFGIYYDDPDTIAEDKLRYLVGVCLPDPKEVSNSDDDLTERLKSNGYQFHTFPACEKAVMTDYPKRNFLSFMLAVTYVYPALKKFTAAYKLTAGPCIEYYEPDMIQFILPLDHHEEFYVPGIDPRYS